MVANAVPSGKFGHDQLRVSVSESSLNEERRMRMVASEYLEDQRRMCQRRTIVERYVDDRVAVQHTLR